MLDQHKVQYLLSDEKDKQFVVKPDDIREYLAKAGIVEKRVSQLRLGGKAALLYLVYMQAGEDNAALTNLKFLRLSPLRQGPAQFFLYQRWGILRVL